MFCKITILLTFILITIIKSILNKKIDHCIKQNYPDNKYKVDILAKRLNKKKTNLVKQDFFLLTLK